MTPNEKFEKNAKIHPIGLMSAKQFIVLFFRMKRQLKLLYRRG